MAEKIDSVTQPFTMADFEKFVARYVWRYAYTMPQIPHWHVAATRALDRAQFQAAGMFIRSNGRDVKFGSRVYRYLRCGDFEYWTQPGDADNALTIINRAKPKA